MPQYFTYAQDAYNQMGPNQKVDFAAGKGYYLVDNPPATVQQATANTVAAALAGQPYGPQMPGSPGAQAVAAALGGGDDGGGGGGGDDGGGGGGGGGVAQALTNPLDTYPSYLAALAAQQARGQALDNALKAYQQRAVVQFGDPALAQLAGFDLNPETAAAAQANTQAGNSTLAQLNRQRDLNQQSIVNNLAAHGLIYSGDLGYRSGQNQQNYGTALYGAQQSVLDNLAQQAASTAAQKAGLSGDVVTAAQNAYNTYIANPQFWGAANDGGTLSAANASASTPTVPPPPAPVTSALAAKPPASRLAQKPVGYGGGATSSQVKRNSNPRY